MQIATEWVGKFRNDLGVVITLTLLLVSCILATALQLPSTADAPTTWVNNANNFPFSFQNLNPMLLSNPSSLTTMKNVSFLCGFYCGDESLSSISCENYFFSVVIAYDDQYIQLWSANPYHPVKLNATLQLTSDGGLVLTDADGTIVWSTNSATRNTSSSLLLRMADYGSLVLFDDKNHEDVWRSFDHPTDTLLLEQELPLGQKLTSTTSRYDSGGSKNTIQYHLSLSDTLNEVLLFIESNPNQLYFRTRSSKLDLPGEVVSNKNAISFLKLTSDGHLNLYSPSDMYYDFKVADVLSLGGCRYPTACGRYGICMGDDQCSCPNSIDNSINYFRPINDNYLDQGCAPITPLACNASEFHSFVTIENVSYYGDIKSGIGDIRMDQCKEACLRKCSCKLAIYVDGPTYYNKDIVVPYCHLLSEVFSLEQYNMKIGVDKYQASAFIKVQNSSHPRIIGKGNNNHMLIVGVSVGGFCISIMFVGGALFWIRKKEKSIVNEDDDLRHVRGQLSRFSFHELKVATTDFTTKLGQGGFGSVFKGVLENGAKVAVKRLDGVGQITKSFLAEVESIGNIHHVNLVRLIGFCAEKSHKLLVYDYMYNGSLDKWIYGKNEEVFLDWKSRRKIVQDVAKGLAYLHEDCRQKICHLDVKPQNILLDGNFNAKLSDFGLAKLIDRDQSKVVTTMRGTPGYLAPEWLKGAVTEKVDVYSFGVVVLEILCGRKHFEAARPEESQHLLSLFKLKAEEGKLADLVDKRSGDMLAHSEEVVEMMKVAGWCLVSESDKRPSMSMVSKVLDGVVDIDEALDYILLNTTSNGTEAHLRDSTTILPSILTGPR